MEKLITYDSDLDKMDGETRFARDNKKLKFIKSSKDKEIVAIHNRRSPEKKAHIEEAISLNVNE